MAWGRVRDRQLKKPKSHKPIFDPPGCAGETMGVQRFSKWEGTGNDFIVIDDRDRSFPTDDLSLVRRLCDRHFGIGSDGLILVQPSATAHYHMEFYNPDGSRSFCGNGSRCAFAFWSGLSGGADAAQFTAIDGEHRARWIDGSVGVSMRDVAGVERDGDVDRIHTGSPHEVVHVADPNAVEVGAEGARRRYDPARGPGGTNVNFVNWRNDHLRMRTYERGVEAETLSCGTGVVAAALSAIGRGLAVSPVRVVAPGGELRVSATAVAGGFTGIELVGPAHEVFMGTCTLNAER